MNFFAVLNHWLHLISVILWIGGAAFQVAILSPYLKVKDPSSDFLNKITTRYRHMVILLLFILVVTGGINFGFRRVGHDEIPPGYISALGVKVFLVVAMASMPLFQLVRSQHDEEADEKATDRFSNNPGTLPGYTFAKLTLIIGVVIIFLASMLRQWRF
ncbi:MAG: hypothetical protein ACE5J1_00105 [Nitrospiria bacterium]